MPVAGGILQQGYDFVVLDVSGDGHDGVGGVVLAGHVIADGLLVDGGNGVGGAANVAAHGLIGPQCLVDEQVDAVGGGCRRSS